mgnify:CR=1 FL=1|jgi:parallel beta-helix repeat protein
MSRVFAAISVLLLVACGSNDKSNDTPDSDYQRRLIERLIDAQPGEVIEIPAGFHRFDRSLMLTTDGVTIRGAGMDKTILSFKEQVTGAEGLLVTASNFTLENLAIEDTIGDGLKVNNGNNIIIRGVRVEWTGGYATENGAYGLYPVQTENVLIEDSVTIGASDAGIYVGQSRNVVVRNNRAEWNVAGIEVENCIGADVYGNVATNNTGGILVFNMPNLPQAGYQTRVYDNDVFANNTENFGHAGTPVASVPAGSGIVINSNDQVEIFNNRLANNHTANIIISSLHTTGYSDYAVQENFDPYPETIWIHDNQYDGGGSSPDGLDLKALKVAMFGVSGRFPDILFDGYVDMNKQVEGKTPDDLRICVTDSVDILNADAPGNYTNPRVETEQYRCTLQGLPHIDLAFL